jgi:hypothetical protein
MTALGHQLGQGEQHTRLVVDEQDGAHARASIIAARADGSGTAVGFTGSVIVAMVPLPTDDTYPSEPPCCVITPARA